jgi:hypothetical protein
MSSASTKGSGNGSTKSNGSTKTGAVDGLTDIRALLSSVNLLADPPADN